jgi:hypothetical protein
VLGRGLAQTAPTYASRDQGSLVSTTMAARHSCHNEMQKSPQGRLAGRCNSMALVVLHHHGGAGWRNARAASNGKGRNCSDNPKQLWPIAIHMGAMQ